MTRPSRATRTIHLANHPIHQATHPASGALWSIDTRGCDQQAPVAARGRMMG